MEKFTVLNGLVAPLDRSNVDTDAIIPKQFLKSIYRTGYGPNCFDEWRYLDKGEPGMDCTKRPLNPDFVLNEVGIERTSLSGREHSACPQELRLRLKSRTCAMGSDAVRFPLRHRAVLCRHFLFQFA